MWWTLLKILYIAVVVIVALRIIYDTEKTGKALAFLLLVIFVPVLGIGVYLLFGVNVRKRKLFKNKSINDKEFFERLSPTTQLDDEEVLNNLPPELEVGRKIIELVKSETGSQVSNDNKVDLLINGENKFPELKKAILLAKHFIHIEYYIFEDDELGRSIEELLIKKANEGINVRLIYDDVGSRSIRSHMIPRMKAAGIKAHPFYEIKYLLLANRLNYRNHRKITIIDGEVAFVGGINIGDEYINNKDDQPFWRDSHLMLKGSAIHYLQYLFITDWNYCSDEDDIDPAMKYFPIREIGNGNQYVQIAASGPDSDSATIHHSMLQTINVAKKELLITTPYFIPGESIEDAICISAQSGVKVKLLVPEKSDNILVDLASSYYYKRLLQAGVEIYRYTKGFVHSKTLIADQTISVIGTANMDIRSFDLNFEVNAIVYDRVIAGQLKEQFEQDLEFSYKIDLEDWENRSFFLEFLENVARLFSPIL